MQSRSNLLLDPDPGASGGTGSALSAGAAGATADWRASLPDDIKADPSIKDFKTLPDLIKSYKHAQTLVGVDKIPKPKADWKPEQWKEFNAALGVPDSPDKYPDATLKVDGVELDPDSIKEAKKMFHDLGIRPDAAQKILDYRMSMLQREQLATKAEQQKAIDTLQAEWKDNFKLNVQTAMAVVKQHGGPELAGYLEKTGLGNNVDLIKLLHKFGTMTKEDMGTTGATNTFLTGPEAAQQEINTLQNDQEFMKALSTASHPGHRNAVDRWRTLFSKVA